MSETRYIWLVISKFENQNKANVIFFEQQSRPNKVLRFTNVRVTQSFLKRLFKEARKHFKDEENFIHLFPEFPTLLHHFFEKDGMPKMPTFQTSIRGSEIYDTQFYCSEIKNRH